MKAVEYKAAGELMILAGMMEDTELLARLAPKWKPGLFTGKWSNLVGKWCMDHFHKYGIAPGGALESIYLDWCDKHHVEEEVQQEIDRFFMGMQKNPDFKGVTTDYLLDLCIHHFNKNLARQVVKEAEQSLDQDEPFTAFNSMGELAPIQFGIQTYSDVFNDTAAIERVFARRQDPLIKFDGEGLAPIGDFFDGMLERDSLVAFMGPEKRGKTWFLLDMAWRAMEQGRRVAFFEVGDMSHEQLLTRMLVRATGNPIHKTKLEIPHGLRITDTPLPMPNRNRQHNNGNNNGQHNEHGPKVTIVETERNESRKPLNRKRAMRAMEQLREEHGRKELLRLSVHPNTSISALGVRAEVQQWERAGWVPDVVIIDYADILAPVNDREQPIDQINTTWKLLRSLSQQLHCLVLTATQANAASYEAHTVTRTHFSGNKLKLAHVNGMVGLSATTDESRKGIMRLNWVVRREGALKDSDLLYVAGCLGIGNPMMVAKFPD